MVIAFRKFLPGLLFMALLLALPLAHKGYGLDGDEVMRQNLSLQLPQGGMDDYLLQVGRLSHLNLIADASRFSPEGDELIKDTHGSLYKLVTEFMYEHGLTTLRYDKHVVLFWSEPQDIAAYVRQALADKATVRAPDAVPSDATIDLALCDYLKQTYGWDIAKPSEPLTLKVSALPADLKNAIINKGLANVFRLSLASPGSENWLHDETWDNAYLKIGGPPGGPISGISVAAPIQDGDRQMEISRLVAMTLAGHGQTDATVHSVKLPPPPQGAPPRTPAAARPVYQVPAPAPTTLDAEPTPQKTVSLEAKRLPLSALLRQAGQQSGVALTVRPGDALNTMPITAYIEQMPLAELMNALSRLCVAQWTPAANHGFVLQSRAVGAFERQQLQLGEGLYGVEYRGGYDEKVRHEDAVAQEIIKSLNPRALRDPQGIPFAALPEALQQKVRYLVVKQVGAILLIMQDRVKPMLAQDWNLKVVSSSYTPQAIRDGQGAWVQYRQLGYPTAALSTADGQGITSFALGLGRLRLPPATLWDSKAPPPPPQLALWDNDGPTAGQAPAATRQAQPLHATPGR